MAISEFPAALSVTVDDMVKRIRRLYLRGDQRPPMNRVDSGPLTTASTTLTCEFTSSNFPKPGSVLEIEDELLYVWATASPACTVERGFDGTTAAQHADGTLIELDPRYPRVNIVEAMRSEIRSWPSSLFAVAAGDLDLPASTNAIDLDGASSLEGVRLLQLTRDQLAQGLSSDVVRESWPFELRARIDARAETDDFPSGWALVVPHEYGEAVNLRCVIGYAFPTGTFASSTDLGSTVGLTADLLDLLELGTAARLLLPKVVQRVDPTAQGRSRRAEEVTASDVLRSGGGLWQLRNERLAVAVKRLASRWGWKEATA